MDDRETVGGPIKFVENWRYLRERESEGGGLDPSIADVQVVSPGAGIKSIFYWEMVLPYVLEGIINVKNPEIGTRVVERLSMGASKKGRPYRKANLDTMLGYSQQRHSGRTGARLVT